MCRVRHCAPLSLQSAVRWWTVSTFLSIWLRQASPFSFRADAISSVDRSGLCRIGECGDSSVPLLILYLFILKTHGIRWCRVIVRNLDLLLMASGRLYGVLVGCILCADGSGCVVSVTSWPEARDRRNLFRVGNLVPSFLMDQSGCIFLHLCLITVDVISAVWMRLNCHRWIFSSLLLLYYGSPIK